MLTELHETQTTMATNQNLKEDLQADEPVSSNLNASIFNVLVKYAPTDGFNIVVDWPADITLKSQWTSEVASSLLQFWGELRWPVISHHGT